MEITTLITQDHKYMINEIKWAWQRVVRGYDDRVFWGFDSYFLQVMPALKEFCHNYIKDANRCNLNPERAAIFSSTLSKIISYELIDEWTDMLEREDIIKDLLTYVGKNSAYYWD